MAQRDEHDGLFETNHRERGIARILERAIAQRLNQSAAARAGAGQHIYGSKELQKIFVPVLTKAMTLKVGKKDNPSTRRFGADGARSFHFEASFVSLDDTARAKARQDHAEATERKRAANGGSDRPTTKPIASPRPTGGGKGAAAAHLAYIEREEAVERLPPSDAEREIARELGLEQIIDRPDEIKRQSKRRSKDEAANAAATAERMQALDRIASTLAQRKAGNADLSRDPAGETDVQFPETGIFADANRGRAAKMQAYMENPEKVRAGTLSSFGTIGESFEDRKRFWELMEEHEHSKDARIQNRLIMELPHQSTPAARAEIMRRFVSIFDALGLPYHVAIHVPGAKNDSRNYHAHVVWSERPARMMQNPTTGKQAWDFAIVVEERDKHRKVRRRHPFRRNKNRDVTRKDFIPKLRAHFAQSVNEVMKDIDPSVRFDPRSYEEMGIAVDPMRTVSRILSKHMRNGSLAISDTTWTKRMIDREIEAATKRRDRDVATMLDTKAKYEKLREAWPDISKINAALGSKPNQRLELTGVS